MRWIRLSSRWAPALLLLGASALYLFALGRAGLYDLDESVYAEISREMVATRDWLIPHLDFIPYLEKPPLLYWLNALVFRVAGLSEFSARFATAAAAIAGIGCVYGLGKDLWGRRAGLASGAVLATSFGYFIFGRMALPDMLFLSLLAAAFWGFGRTIVAGAATRGDWPLYAAYAAMGGAVMTKGLIGLIFPAATIGAFLLLTREWRLLRRLHLFRGGAVFLAVALPWHVLVALRDPAFLRFYLLNEQFARFLGHRSLVNYASLPIPTYLAMTFVWFCPWTLFLPAALARRWPGRPGRPEDRGVLFVLLWAAAVIGFFAVSASRLEYYALPALPALALFVGRFWDGEIPGSGGEPLDLAADRASAPRSTALTLSWIAVIGFALCLVPAAFLFPRLERIRFYNIFPDPPGTDSGFARLIPLFLGVAAVISLGAFAAAAAWFRRRPRLALGCLALTTAVGLATVGDGFRLFQPYRSIVRLAGVLRHQLRPADQLVLEGRYERHAGLGFYTGRRIRIYHGREGVLLNGSFGDGLGKTFLSDAAFARLWRGPRRAYLLTDSPDCLRRMRALSPATIVLGRSGATWLLANHPGFDIVAAEP